MSKKGSQTLNESIAHLKNQPWFSNLSRDQAEKELAKQPAGSFLIRPSRNADCLALSHKVSNGTIGHALIHYSEKGFQLEQTLNVFPSLEILVLSVKKHYTKDQTPGAAANGSATASPALENASQKARVDELTKMFPNLSRESRVAALQFAQGDSAKAADLVLSERVYSDEHDESSKPVRLITAAIRELQPLVDRLGAALAAIDSWESLKQSGGALGEALKESKRVLGKYPREQSQRPAPTQLPPGPQGTTEENLIKFKNVATASVWEIQSILDTMLVKITAPPYNEQLDDVAAALGDVKIAIDDAFQEYQEKADGGGGGGGGGEEFYIDLAKVEIGKEIGKGAYGTVYKGRFGGRDVAIKTLNVKDKKEMVLIRREISLLRECKHPNITELMGVAQKGGALLLVMEFVDRGEYYALLKDEKIDMPWSQRLKAAEEVASALAYIHSKGLMHRDIKSENLLVDSKWNVKLCDFGFARAVSKGRARYTVCGSMYFNAPELLLGKPYGPEADTFSFGILVIEIITRGQVELRRSKASAFGLDVQALAKHISKDCPPPFFKIAACCCSFNQSNRPKMQQVFAVLQKIRETWKGK